MIKKSDIKWIDTNQYLTIHYKGRPVQLKKGTERHQRAVSLMDRGRNKELVDFLFPSRKGVVKYAKGAFNVDENGLVRIKGVKEPVNEVIAKYLLEFYRNKYDYMALVKFWENLSKNPSDKSKEELYLFLRANKMPITPDGCFLAYKKVNKDKGHLWDGYTGTICNDIGKRVWMKREEVDPDRNRTCSHGLHVAAWNYAQGYSGDVLLEVKVNPKDVVSVPDDYHNEKMRVCEYIPWSLSKSPIDQHYLAPEALRLKKKYSLRVMKTERLAIGKNQEVLLEGKTAQQIIDFVKERTNHQIEISVKSKKSIVKKATELLQECGIRKNVSLRGKTAREIVDVVKEQTGVAIETSIKNKESVINKAFKILKKYGFSVRKK